MRKRRGLGSAILGLSIGLLIGLLIINCYNSTTPLALLYVGKNPRIEENSINGTVNPKSTQLVDNVHPKYEQNINGSSKNLIFVGVMTASKYLENRAKAVYETWGKQVPGKIAFFSSEFSSIPKSCPDLPLVSLPTVDDSYPPQKKSFLMLQYMWNNYGDRFEWFLRADDDVYIRTNRLETFLKSIDSKKPMYIGQAGRGKSEEFGLLSLEYDENFCMGGPGVILSRETLKIIVPHIKHCLKNLYTVHEDVELGRCVQKYAGIPCTWSYEMQSILYHNSSGDQAFTGNLKKKEVHRAITLHPVKHPQQMYRLHNHLKGLEIRRLQHERLQLHRDIYAMTKQLNNDLADYEETKDLSLARAGIDSADQSGDPEILRVAAGLRCFKPSNSMEVLPWEFISRSQYSLMDSNPRRRIHGDVKEGLDDITREVMTFINACSRQRGRIVEERSALYGYRRVDSYGADTIIDLLLVYRKYRGRKVTLPVRRHVYVHQHFTSIEIREVENPTNKPPLEMHADVASSTQSISSYSFFNFPSYSSIRTDSSKDILINFILPLSGRYEILSRFLNNYEDVCITKNERTALTIMLYSTENSLLFNRTVDHIERLKLKYPDAKIELVINHEQFSRAKALDAGVKNNRNEDLVFFVDVDIVFTSLALKKIRLNTILNKRMYFPIVFSQFDLKYLDKDVEDFDNFNVDEDLGYWRQFGFGIVSLYKEDYVSVGGFDLTIQGWGKEDVDFFEKVVKSDFQIFRAPDGDLVHIYHDIVCDNNLSPTQLAMCKGSKVDTFASIKVSANLVQKNPDYILHAKMKRFNVTGSVA